MRNFYYKCISVIAIIYIGFVCALGFRLGYNQYYAQIYKDIETVYDDGEMVYPLGKIVGIYTKCKGVLVIDTSEIESKGGEFVSPAEGVLRSGDYILEANGIPLEEKETLVEEVNRSQGNAIHLLVRRGDENFETSVTPIMGKNGKYMLGVWVKDDLAGVGTITYYTEDGAFGALGHGMGDGVTKEILSVEGGDIYYANIVGIQVGERGIPGEVKGVIYYGLAHHIGEVDTNCKEGIYGNMDTEDIIRYKSECEAYKLGNKQSVEAGNAQIITDVSGERKIYDIKITYVDYLALSSNKGIHIEVTDPELLELTGGIVQGMSGSPIIQNGKLIGAVTHVLINDPTKGYGIFIDEMLEK